ncbi:MAG: glycosyltransferase family 4 protein, partial [Actinomycetota bacterium]
VQIPPGVDAVRFAPLSTEERAAVRSQYGIGEEQELVVSVSRLVTRKGMDVLIRATHQLKDLHPNLVVAIGGRGRKKKHLQRLANRGPGDIRFLDFVADDDLPALFGAADVFAMLCRNRWGGLEQEGFGIVFLEAAACGVPQLAGRSGGSADAVVEGETGRIVGEPRSTAAVAAALHELLESSDRARMGAESRRRAQASFNYDVLSSTLGRSLSVDEAP